MAASFHYSKLQPGQDAIRILTIEPGAFLDALVCSLKPVAFNANPRYAALSYTWKDAYPDNANIPTSLLPLVGETPRAHAAPFLAT